MAAACDVLVAFALVPFLVIEPIQCDLRASAAMIMKLTASESEAAFSLSCT